MKRRERPRLRMKMRFDDTSVTGVRRVSRRSLSPVCDKFNYVLEKQKTLTFDANRKAPYHTYPNPDGAQLAPG